MELNGLADRVVKDVTVWHRFWMEKSIRQDALQILMHMI